MSTIPTGYKQTELGVIPEDWDAAPLGGFVKITSGASPSLFRFCGAGIPYFKVEQLNNAEKNLDSSHTPYFFASGDTVPERSVLFAKRGAAIALNKVRIIEQPSFMDTNLMALTPQNGLESDYLFYALGHIGLWRFADTTSVPQINNKHIKPLPFPFPSLPEQRAIAAALSDVDALLTKLDQLIAKKRDLKQATMQQLLTGQTRLPGFSGAWEVKRLGDVSQLMNGFAFKSSTYNEFGRYKVVTIANVQDGFMNIEVCNKVAQLPQDIQFHQCLIQGDILISMTGNVGRVCRVCDDNCLLNQRVGKLIPVGIDGSFLFAILHQPSFLASMANKAKGGAQGNLSKADITEYELNLPSSKEQTAIATVLSDMDAELAALETRRDKTRTLKQGMMQELLTGRIRLN